MLVRGVGEAAPATLPIPRISNDDLQYSRNTYFVLRAV